MFTDKDTCSFVLEQKRIEFHDLKHALKVMGRLEHTAEDNVVDELSSLSRTSPEYCRPSSPNTKEHLHQPPLASPSPLLTTSQTHPPSNQSPHEVKPPHSTSPQTGTKLMPELSPFSSQEHRKLSPSSPPCTPHDFVAIFLLENNRLLSASVNQMDQEEQVS